MRDGREEARDGTTFLIKRGSEVELRPGAEKIFRTVTVKSEISENWRRSMRFGGQAIYNARNLPEAWKLPLRKVLTWYGKMCLGFQPNFHVIDCCGSSVERLDVAEEGPPSPPML